MVVEYSLRILKERRNELLNTLFDIDNGEYDRHPKEYIKKLKTDITHKLKDIEFAIEVLETYQDSEVIL